MALFNILSDWLGSLTPGSKLSRRAWVVIKYKPKGGTEAKDISEDISKYFLSLSFTDNLSGKADDVTLELEDKAQLWLEEWFPERGSLLSITIHTYNWLNLNEGEVELPLGNYQIDEIDANGMPSTVQIKAVSVIGDGTLRGVTKNRTWENISVWKCASDICQENGLELFWDCEENPNLDHVEQADQSDLDFLDKICKDNGRSLKVTPERVIIFDDKKYEEQKPQLLCLKPTQPVVSLVDGALDAGDMVKVNLLTGYRLTAKTRDVYWKCHVKYAKGKDKTVIEAEFADPNKQDGPVLHVGDQVQDKAEAERLAKKKLREKNKDEFKGSFSTMGNFNIMAGLTIQLHGFGKFDGIYIIEKASHTISSAYTTSFDIRRCLDGY